MMCSVTWAVATCAAPQIFPDISGLVCCSGLVCLVFYLPNTATTQAGNVQHQTLTLTILVLGKHQLRSEKLCSFYQLYFSYPRGCVSTQVVIISHILKLPQQLKSPGYAFTNLYFCGVIKYYLLKDKQVITTVFAMNCLTARCNMDTDYFQISKKYRKIFLDWVSSFKFYWTF